MPAYLIADIDVTDPAGFEAYRQRVPTTLQPYGGRVLVWGGAVEALEGDWQPKRVVITAFPSLEQARRWDNSEAYREPKALRFKTATSKVMLVEGVERRQVTRPQSPHAVQRLPPKAAAHRTIPGARVAEALRALVQGGASCARETPWQTAVP